MHDDRGNARVEWIDAGYAGVPLERAPLSIESTPARGENAKLTVERKRAGGFDPYARVGAAHIPEPKKPQRQARSAQARRVDQAQTRARSPQIPGRYATSNRALSHASSGVALDVAQLAHISPAIEPAQLGHERRARRRARLRSSSAPRAGRTARRSSKPCGTGRRGRRRPPDPRARARTAPDAARAENVRRPAARSSQAQSTYLSTSACSSSSSSVTGLSWPVFQAT